MTQRDAIVSILKDWDNTSLIDAWNEHCNNDGYSDERVFFMGEFNDFFCNMTPLDIVSMVEHTNFRTNDEFFAYDSYGRLVSFDYIEDYSCFDYDQLADYFINNGDDNTDDVDRDELTSLFYDAMEIGDRSSNSFNYDVLLDILTKYIEDNNIDILTDDWDEVAGEFIEFLHTDYNEKTEED